MHTHFVAARLGDAHEGGDLDIRAALELLDAGTRDTHLLPDTGEGAAAAGAGEQLARRPVDDDVLDLVGRVAPRGAGAAGPAATSLSPSSASSVMNSSSGSESSCSAARTSAFLS